MGELALRAKTLISSAARKRSFSGVHLHISLIRKWNTLHYLAWLQSAFDVQLRKLQYGKMKREGGLTLRIEHYCFISEQIVSSTGMLQTTVGCMNAGVEKVRASCAPNNAKQWNNITLHLHII